MAGLELKEYQKQSLAAIARICDGVRGARAVKAVRPVHDAYYAETGRDFIAVPQLPNTPYVCLRVPTGGGKTLIAAHAVGVIGKRLGRQDRPLCLWVTPSTTIRDQTLRALKDDDHPYFAALRDGLGGAKPEVLTIEDALGRARAAMLSSSAVIIVTTIQSYRIDNPDNRRIYDDNGYLMDNFSNLPQDASWQMKDPASGRVLLSLANVMKLRGPIVIMDEAHNARTRISFDSLARFAPQAVLELTATPQQEHDPDKDEYASNVLYAVSALQLSNDGIIKLPVELESRDNWLDVLATTVQRRKELETRAQAWGQQSGRFIRPIALIQAQPKSKARETHTVDAIKKALIEQLQVPEERIRIATGDHDDLGDEDLKARGCKVEYILTVDKLREGWDCPFAYVLGSVGNVATETAVEQLLGRVLRMPEALPTGISELDRAYAIVQSPDVIRTAKNLCDSLISRCGFDADTVNDALRVHRNFDGQTRLPLDTIPLSAPPKVESLPPTLTGKIRYDAASGTLQVNSPLVRDEVLALRDSLEKTIDRTAVERYWDVQRSVGTAAKSLDQYAPPMRVPQLILRDGKGVSLFEPIELEEFSWNLEKCDTIAPADEFRTELDVGTRVTVGLTDAGGVRIGESQEIFVRQLSIVPEDENWSKVRLVRWLDAELHHDGEKFRGLTKADSQAWLLRLVDYLLNQRRADLAILVRKRHELADVAIRRIAEHGCAQVRVAAQGLFATKSERRLETSLDIPAELTEQDYCPYRQYHGLHEFKHHAFDLIGDMGKDEEPDCAKRIDDHPNVKRWVRNLSYESAGGFSLPLSPGHFFPDFVAELKDGRIALVEYKGRQRDPLTEEQFKKDIGELWAARSNGKCVFAWVVDRDWETLQQKLSPQPPR